MSETTASAPGDAATTSAPAAPPADMRTFTTLWATQTLSLFGTFVTQFAINIWLTQELYPSPEQKAALALGLSATSIAFMGPMVFVMPIAGAFADRHDRRRILLAANAASCLLTLALVALHAAHALTLPLAVVLLAGYSVAASFHSAAFDSSLPLLAPPGQLSRANGMMMSSFALSQLLSPAIAATLIGVPSLVRAQGWPLPWIARLERGTAFAFATDSLTFVVALVAIALVPLRQPPRGPDAHRQGVFALAREGFVWIVRRRSFLWLIGFGSLANLMLAPLVLLLPVIVRDRLRADWSGHVDFPTALATVNVAAGVGGVLGGVLVSVWGGRVKRRAPAMIACIGAVGLFEALAGFATSVRMAGAAMFAAQLFVAPLNTFAMTLWQSLTPPPMLARAMSTRRFISQSFFPLGMAISGWLAVPVEPAWLLVGAGSLLAIACASQLAGGRLATLEERMREEAARP